jgi:hypothetical protein
MTPLGSKLTYPRTYLQRLAQPGWRTSKDWIEIGLSNQDLPWFKPFMVRQWFPRVMVLSLKTGPIDSGDTMAR